MNLDFSLKTPKERAEHVRKVIADYPEAGVKYKDYISDYLLFAGDKGQTKKERQEENPIITHNRAVTVRKRQVSYEGLVDACESGEDGVQNLIIDDKNHLLDNKEKLTDEDFEESAELRELAATLESLKRQFQKAEGRRKYSLKCQIIETWQQMYIVKSSMRGASAKARMTGQVRNFAHMPIPEKVWIGDDGMPHSDAVITLLNPHHVSFLLCYYSQLKQECEDDLQSDMHFLLLDLEDLAEESIKGKHPELWDILVWKVDGLTNSEIAEKLNAERGTARNSQYVSTLWRRRIPKLITEQASKNWLLWYYTDQEKGKWKVCGKCGETKLAHPLFFSRNSSHDGFYSICKECRSKESEQ